MSRLKIGFPYLVLLAIVAVAVVSSLPTGTSVTGEAASGTPICRPCGMEVDPATELTASDDGRTLRFCSEACRRTFLVERANPTLAAATPADTKRLMDVVCHMEVNASWGIHTQHRGTRYFFCAERCRERFEEDPDQFLATKCMVCREPIGGEPPVMVTYLGKGYPVCSLEHRDLFKADSAAYFMHTMWGLPTWLYYASIALVLVVSFGLFEFINRKAQPRSVPNEPGGDGGHREHISAAAVRGEGERLVGGGASGGEGALSLPIARMTPVGALSLPATDSATPHAPSDRYDLLSIRWVRAAIRSRLFRFTMQLLFVIAFVTVLFAGLFGNQNPAQNIAPILTWTIWWGLLPILIIFGGKAWCYVCPWDAIAGWTEKLAFWKKREDGLSLNLRWPRMARNIWLATFLFVGLTWIELGFGVTMKPRVTAYLGICMLLLALVSAMLFQRKGFCRYACLVGRVSGLYALFSGIEIRPRNAETCEGCGSKECVTGSETAYGCPTFLYPGKLDRNTYCIQCMECIQACPHDNLALNLRPLGEDLAAEGKPRSDEAYLALLMLAITGFHGLTMTPVWQELVDAIRSAAGLGRIVGFSVAMAFLMIAPIGLYAILVGVSRWLGGSVADRGSTEPGSAGASLTYRDYFIRYSYALLPIAMFYHIAHNSEHLLMEGPKVAALCSDPFGWGWNLFGTAGWTIPPLISLDKLWLVQVFLVLIGHVYSLWVAQRTSLRLFGSRRAAFKSQVPMLLGMICFSVFSLWLLKQPMEMRTSAM